MNRLALFGGTPVRTRPLNPWPHFDADQIEAAGRVLASGRVNYWTGTEGREFEREYAQATGSPYAVAVANGTVSLEFILRAWGIGPGDEVITTPRTFVGTSTAIVAVGATPVFADVDATTQGITADTVAPHITPRTRAILPVHLGGWPADMDALMALADRHGLRVLEDCAQAHGATWKGRPVGSIGHAGSFSFCQDKILTTAGEGGLITLADQDTWRAVWALKDHGKSFAAVYEREHPPGFRWLVESFGTNGRMTEVQAAIGRIQLRRLPQWTARRTAHALHLAARLAHSPALRIPLPTEDVGHAWYKWYAFVEPRALAPGWTRDRILLAIQAEGIPCQQGSCSEIYLEKAFEHGLRPTHPLPVARELGETAILAMVHPTLETEDMDDTAEAIDRVLQVATTLAWPGIV